MCSVWLLKWTLERTCPLIKAIPALCYLPKTCNSYTCRKRDNSVLQLVQFCSSAGSPDEYDPSKTNYHPVEDACWKSEQLWVIRYSVFVQGFLLISFTALIFSTCFILTSVQCSISCCCTNIWTDRAGIRQVRYTTISKSRWRLLRRRSRSSLSRCFSKFQPSRIYQAIFLSLKIPLARLTDVSKVVNRNCRPHKLFTNDLSFFFQ